MEYSVYKFKFLTDVHLGTGLLNDSAMTFHADTLFSALYIEAMRLGRENELLSAVEQGKLLFSDAFPFVGDTYLIPKPLLYIEGDGSQTYSEKRTVRKMQFLPVEKVEEYLSGNLNLENDPMEDFGVSYQRVLASVRLYEEAGEKADTLPYHVGTYRFSDHCGLYIVTATESPKEKVLMEELLEALSYTGIGGKRSEGLGKFEFCFGKKTEKLMELLQKKSGNSHMLLSVALPEDQELDHALQNAVYQMEKRSGFVASETYAEEFRKKRDLYVFSASSCFKNTFKGGVFDVSQGGKHPVYRYAKALFLEV